jgi:RNA polymerase subunit RPABC4/transcription elongation factor Spt4
MRRVRHNSGNDSPGERGGNGPGDRDDRDWDLSEGLDPEGPSASDLDKFGSELDSCPNCRSTIYDQSEMCPECGWYLGETEKSVSLWVFVGVVGLIVILLFWMI